MAAMLGFLGVAIGAFGAHSLPKFVDAAQLEQATDWWRTGAMYHLLHAVALLALRGGDGNAPVGRAGWCFTIGIGLFSGTLYAMALRAPRVLGAVTPIGGILLLAGWLLVALRRD